MFINDADEVIELIAGESHYGSAKSDMKMAAIIKRLADLIISELANVMI